MPKAGPLTYRELMRRLRQFGVTERVGGGSRRMLYKDDVEGLKACYAIHVHSDNAEVHAHIIRTILRRFKISEDSFWNL